MWWGDETKSCISFLITLPKLIGYIASLLLTAGSSYVFVFKHVIWSACFVVNIFAYKYTMNHIYFEEKNSQQFLLKIMKDKKYPTLSISAGNSRKHLEYSWTKNPGFCFQNCMWLTRNVMAMCNAQYAT